MIRCTPRDGVRQITYKTAAATAKAVIKPTDAVVATAPPVTEVEPMAVEAIPVDDDDERMAVMPVEGEAPMQKAVASGRVWGQWRVLAAASPANATPAWYKRHCKVLPDVSPKVPVTA